jgi:hypothetical protein
VSRGVVRRRDASDGHLRAGDAIQIKTNRHGGAPWFRLAISVVFPHQCLDRGWIYRDEWTESTIRVLLYHIFTILSSIYMYKYDLLL